MKILIVDDEPAARYGMAKALRADGRSILEAGDGDEALALIRDTSPDLVFLDLNMPGRDGLAVLTELLHEQLSAKPEIIVVTANDTVQHAVECIRRGANDFLAKPFDVDHLRAIARRSQERVQLQQRVAVLQSQVDSGVRFGQLLGSSRPMQRLFRQIEKAAATALPILIRGESGTGKELVARELHLRSDRASQSFIAVNTAAITESLVESELFGHVKGAFTGAERAREGVFRQADGGTLFLDEIGDMPASVQTRLLRVLQEGIVQPVGTDDGVNVDVRVISATHQDLKQAIADKVFRQDLYFRLKGIELFIPALRSRQEDILLLANEFLDEATGANSGPAARLEPGNAQCQLHGDQVSDANQLIAPEPRELSRQGARTPKSLSGEAVSALLQYAWPGNVRELQQMISAAVALCDGDAITAHDLGLVAERSAADGVTFDKYLDLPLTESRQQLVEDFERTAISRAIKLDHGNVSAAARRLGIHRQSLQQKMKQLGIPPS